MKKLKVEKFIDKQLDESFNVPIAFIRVLGTILPHSAMSTLVKNGFDFAKIIEMSKQNQPYQMETIVAEKGINKKIIITLL